MATCFPCLRHDTFVGGDDEQADVDASRAGDHRAHERFVARNVDDADGADAVQLQRSEAEDDGDPATLFLQAAGRCRHR